MEEKKYVTFSVFSIDISGKLPHHKFVFILIDEQLFQYNKKMENQI